MGRGGDPERSDNFGNTALHLAAARGHMNAVTFLVNFGVNLHSLDIGSFFCSDNQCPDIQGLTIRPFPGCENIASMLRQKG